MTWIRSLPFFAPFASSVAAAEESLGRTDGARGWRTVGAWTERERERWMRALDCEAARPGRATVGERSLRLSPFIVDELSIDKCSRSPETFNAAGKPSSGKVGGFGRTSGRVLPIVPACDGPVMVISPCAVTMKGSMIGRESG